MRVRSDSRSQCCDTDALAASRDERDSTFELPHDQPAPESRSALVGTDGFSELTALGAHPLLALSARQVSEIELRRQQETATDGPKTGEQP